MIAFARLTGHNREFLDGRQTAVRGGDRFAEPARNARDDHCPNVHGAQSTASARAWNRLPGRRGPVVARMRHRRRSDYAHGLHRGPDPSYIVDECSEAIVHVVEEHRDGLAGTAHLSASS